MRLLVLLLLLPALASAQDLVLNGGTHTLGGVQTYDNVTITGGATVFVTPFNGDVNTSGYLRFDVAGTFTLDAGSAINGDGRGYRAQTNSNGEGPGGGQGGSCCADGGGGGAYGGGGGRATIDNGSRTGGVGGNPYGDANAKQLFMGSAGGSAGTSDGDGGGGAGSGGARVWIDAATAVVAGTIRVHGTNGSVVNGDAAGGGAGGGILVDADDVTISGSLSANGGTGGNVDDDGGGGGGGRIKVFHGALALTGSLSVAGGTGPDNAGEGAAGTTATILENTPPTAAIAGPPTADEGVPATVDGTPSSDADGTVVAWAWDCDGDGQFDDATGSVATCTFADGPDTVLVGLQVTDDGGATASTTVSVPVANVSPTGVLTLPGGDEGEALALSTTTVDVADDTVSVTWDFGDGSPAAIGDAVSHAWSEDGSYAVAATLEDEDGGSTVLSGTVVIGNAPPALGSLVAPDGDEGELLAFDLPAADGPSDPLTWSWDFGDGSPAASGQSPTHAYGDDGSYTVTVTVTDDEGGSASTSATVTIANLAPSLDSLALVDGLEGDLLTLSATASDPVGDALTITWDFGDGSPAQTGASVTHAFADDGAYTVTATVDDGVDAAAASGTVTVANVAPTITSTPPVAAVQGVAWTYAPTADDPGADVLSWSLTTAAPPAMTVDPATGDLAWTPDAGDVGTAPSFVLVVDDGDGGSDTQLIDLTVGAADSDGDGIADDWETDNGLDPTDPSDAAEDPDGDNLTNLDEFLGGTNPQQFNGPDAPVPLEPLGATTSARPNLLVANATDPDGDALTYTFEVYADAGLTTLLEASPAVAEEPVETTWKATAALPENADAWWRARAHDGVVAGPWSTVETFFVDDANEPPTTPAPTFPLGGEAMTATSDALAWTESTDPEGDAVEYAVEVRQTEVVWTDATPDLELPLGFAPDENAAYEWRVRAGDGELWSAWSDWEGFVWDATNDAPFGVVFVEPLDGAVVGRQPTLVATAGEDPEGGALTYVFEVDGSPAFDGPDRIEGTASDDGVEARFDLAAAGEELPAGAELWARVQAVDDSGAASVPDVIRFTTEADAQAPPVPVLLSPADGEELATRQAVLVLQTIESEQVLLYEFRAGDAAMTDPVESGIVAPGSGPEGDEARTSWVLPGVVEGETFWTARSVDVDGLASDWAPLRSFTPPAAPEIPEPDPEPVVYTGGLGDCDCQSSLAPGAGAPLLLLLPLLLRRRR